MATNNTVTVANAAQLATALQGATTDTTIVLKAGNYGNLNLFDHQNGNLGQASAITFISEDPANPAVFTGLDVRDSNNITFDSVTFDYNAPNGASLSAIPFSIMRSDNITIVNSTFDGDAASGVNATSNGYGTGVGLMVRGSDNINISNNVSSNFYRGMLFDQVNDLTVQDNELTAMSSDGLNFVAVTDVLIEGNYIHDFAANPNTNAHKDFIQFWNTGSTTATTDVVIRGNILDSGQGVEAQSLFFGNTLITNNKNHHLKYQNILIEDNVIRNAHKNAIYLQWTDGLVVRNNTVLHNADSGPDTSLLHVPAINVLSGISNEVISNNVMHAINGASFNGSGNIFVQRTSPTTAGYYEDQFVNGLSDSLGTWQDLMVLPGSQIAQAGAGSSLLQFDTTPASPFGLILDDAGTGLQMNQHDFDVSNIFGPNGQINTNGATVVWDFGDGTTGSGLTASHAFLAPDIYEVTATITLSNGQTIVADKVVTVSTPVAIQVDFENGTADQSGLQNGTYTSGTVRFVQDGGSTVAKLGSNNAAISYRRTPELFDNTSYTVLVDFRKDQLNDTGKIINFTGSFIIKATATGLNLAIHSDQSVINKTINGLGLDDTAWHRLALTYDETQDSAAIYLDGAHITTIGNLVGTMQSGFVTHDFHIGSPFGQSFQGLVDNVWFLKGAMSGTDVASLHAGNQTVDEIINAGLVNVPGTGGGGSGGGGGTGGGGSGGGGGGTGGGGTGGGGGTLPPPPADADHGTLVKGLVKSNMDDHGDTVFVADTVTTSELQVLLNKGRVRFDADNDGTLDHVIRLAGDFSNGAFVASPVQGGTLISFQPAGGGGGGGGSGGGGTGGGGSGGGGGGGLPPVPAGADYGALINGLRKYFIDDHGDTAFVADTVTTSELQVLLNKGRVRFDADNDGTLDHVIRLAGDFSNGAFVASAVQGGTLISFQPTGGGGGGGGTGGGGSGGGSGGGGGGSVSFNTLPFPTVQDSVTLPTSQINGIVDPTYLSGQISSDYTISIQANSTARFANTLGVYEYDSQGNIYDVRIVAPNMLNANGSISVSNVDPDKTLGFFMVQNGFNKLGNGVFNSNDLSLKISNGVLKLYDDDQSVPATIFVSHDPNLNRDGLTHVISGVDPNGSGGMLISFEDQTLGKAHSDGDFNDAMFVITADTMDFV